MSQEERKVKFEDFFDFDAKEPINRLAYTKEDMDYKIKIIKKMQELGMDITVDKACNVCGTIKMGNNPKKTLAIGSHTDSVYDGGQYDGPAGVCIALDTVEKLSKSKNVNGIIKVAIYACEESSRFGNACIGSKYLNGNINEEKFSEIYAVKEKDKKVLLKDEIQKSIEYLKENVEGIKEVEKIFDKVDYSLEAHIEQYQILHKQHKKHKQEIIGIVNTVGSAVRVEYDVLGRADHTGSTPMDKRRNAATAVAYIGVMVNKLGKKYDEKQKGRADQVDIWTMEHERSFNQTPRLAHGDIDFRLIGETKPDEILADFDKIVKKVEKKTKTEIKPHVISQGKPIITSAKLNKKIAEVCDNLEVQHKEMPSYPGQDTGYVPAKQKTMIFIPSKGGSHNPLETTKKQHLELGSKVIENVVQELLRQKEKDKWAVDLEGKKVPNNKKSKDKIKGKEVKTQTEVNQGR